jgi:hypothetical protein
MRGGAPDEDAVGDSVVGLDPQNKSRGSAEDLVGDAPPLLLLRCSRLVCWLQCCGWIKIGSFFRRGSWAVCWLGWSLFFSRGGVIQGGVLSCCSCCSSPLLACGAGGVGNWRDAAMRVPARCSCKCRGRQFLTDRRIMRCILALGLCSLWDWDVLLFFIADFSSDELQ